MNRNVVSVDDYASCFKNIDPLLPYKNWTVKQISYQNITTKGMSLRDYVHSQKVQAVFIVSDSVDWSRDIQVGVKLLVFMTIRERVIHLQIRGS